MPGYVYHQRRSQTNTAIGELLLLLRSGRRFGLLHGLRKSEPKAGNLIRHKLLILSHCASPRLHWSSVEHQNERESSCLFYIHPSLQEPAAVCSVPWLKGSPAQCLFSLGCTMLPHYHLLHKSLTDRKHSHEHPCCSCRTASASFFAQDPLCSTAQPSSKVSNMPLTTHPACQKINASN